MPMTSYLRKQLGDEVLNKGNYSAPGAVYLALFTASPGDAGSLTSEISTSGTAYARQEVTSKLSAFDATTGIATSTAEIAFSVPTADWGVVTYVGIIDSGGSPAGTLLFYDPVSAPRNVTNGGRRVVFATGQLTVRLT